MPVKQAHPRISLPSGWHGRVKSAVLHTISLARFSIVHARGMAASHIHRRVRLAAQNERLREECSHLHEEIRIKDARMAHIAPQRQPHYSPCERMAILELRAARGWTLKQTADTFSVTAATIASWSARLGEDGPNALLQLPVPVNKYPDFVRYLVQRVLSKNSTEPKISRIPNKISCAPQKIDPSKIKVLKELPNRGETCELVDFLWGTTFCTAGNSNSP